MPVEPKVIVEKQDVTNEHPLQYKFTTYKTVKDINGVDVQVEDKAEIKNTLGLDLEKVQLNQQIIDLQAKIAEVDAKITLINNLL